MAPNLRRMHVQPSVLQKKNRGHAPSALAFAPLGLSWLQKGPHFHHWQKGPHFSPLAHPIFFSELPPCAISLLLYISTFAAILATYLSNPGAGLPINLFNKPATLLATTNLFASDVQFL